MNRYTVRSATPETLEEALRVACTHLSAEHYTLRSNLLQKTIAMKFLRYEDIIEVCRDEQIVGVAIIQPRDDAPAMFWPPSLLPGEPKETLSVLLEAFDQYCLKNSIKMAILSTDYYQEIDESALAEHGIEYISNMLYLTAHEMEYPSACPADRLEFVPIHVRPKSKQGIGMPPEQLPKRLYDDLAKTIEATYQDTKDYPSLMGETPAGATFKAYLPGSVFKPEIWFRIYRKDKPIGVLLLMDRAQEGHTELMYMGLIKSERGKGFAKEIVDYALWVSGELGRYFQVVSVDENNRNAVQTYQKCGFRFSDKKKIYAKKF